VRQASRWCIGLAALLLVVGCDSDPEDTCTEGDNMGNPKVEDGFDPTLAAPALRITWSAGTGNGTDLSPEYFDQVAVALETDVAVRDLISSLARPAPREIVVTFAALDTFLASQSELDFTLEFPDREEFIMCSHPGMADRYLLDVSVTLDSGAVVSSELSQRVQLGAI
jgi:hypothetical protein